MDTVMNWLSGGGCPYNKLQHLKRNARALSARVEDINNEIEQEELQPGKRRRREVDNWLKDADDTLNQLQCLEKRCKDLSLSERGSSNQRAGLSEQIRELIDQGRFPKGLTFYDHGSSSVALVTTDIKINDNILHLNRRKVVSWLIEDEMTSIIGVYGPGGVGKTMLLKETYNELLERYKSSKHVYWVTLSHGTTPPMLQDKIAEAMELSYLLTEKSTIRKAASLFYELSQRKNVLLFVDDVWDHFSFEKVGIPIGDHGCKLILTTRSLDVCRRMNCQKVLKVQPLSKEKAWELFTEVLGKGKLSSEIKELAGLIVAECAGLPLGLIIMAGSMRGVDDIEEWRNTLEDLRNSAEGQTVIETELFPVLKLSFDRLKDPKLRQCFLLCAMYPKYTEIKRDELIRLFRSEGLLDTMESWQKQFDKGYSMLKKLENVCLLETYDTRCVKMHNFIRDMAIRITNVMPRFMMAAGLELRTIPSGPNWKINLEKASLMHNSLSEIELGTIPMCPCLTTLLLQKNPFTKLPDSFFSEMYSLKVLNLSETSIKKLPDTISELRNLRALLLESCKRLNFVPSLVKLTNLRELDLSLCWALKDVPHGMEQLVDLRFLDIEGTKDLCRLLSRSLSKLSRIQCLKLDPDVQSISGDDLLKLGYLERLEGCRIADVSSFNRYVKTQHFQRLNYFQFFIGEGEYKRFNDSTSDERAVILCSRILRGSNGDFFVLPDNTQNLQIHNSELGERSLIDALPSLTRLKELKTILIRRCRVMEVICSAQPCSEGSSMLLFQYLRKLILTDLLDFSGLVKEGVSFQQGAFSNLKILVIKFCPKIKELLTPNMLNGNLDNLQELEVEGCDQLETIIVACDNVDKQEEFIDFGGYENKESNLSWLPSLRSLQLRRLPKLGILCHGGFLGKRSIEQIAVEYCAEIKNIFVSSSPKNHMENLREVKVSGCQNLQEIVASPNSEDEQSGILELPNLKAIELDDLPCLTSFFRENIPTCGSIEIITVWDCPRVKRLPVSIPLYSNGEQLAPLSLREIKANREWWESLKWDDTYIEQILLPFTKLSEPRFKGLDSPGSLKEHDKISSTTKEMSVCINSCLTELSDC